MNVKLFRDPPKRNDDGTAKRWRGPLFWDLCSTAFFLETPRSVTFPLCHLCGHLIWDWPHFEEPVPDNAVCEVCFKEEEEDNKRGRVE